MSRTPLTGEESAGLLADLAIFLLLQLVLYLLFAILALRSDLPPSADPPLFSETLLGKEG